jgi:hypothetical protein
MIEIMPESRGNVLDVRASGKLTHDEYRQLLIPRLESLFAEHDKLNVLFLMDANFKIWELDAAWDDASYGPKHNAGFCKPAVAGGPAEASGASSWRAF